MRLMLKTASLLQEAWLQAPQEGLQGACALSLHRPCATCSRHPLLSSRPASSTACQRKQHHPEKQHLMLPREGPTALKLLASASFHSARQSQGGTLGIQGPPQ